MSAIETVRQCMQAVEKGDYKEAEKYLTEDFMFAGAVPKPIGRGEWLDLHKSLANAIPNFMFNVTGFHEENNKVIFSVHLTGKHSRELNIHQLNIGPVAATNKSISLPNERVEATLKNGKIARLDVERVSGGGLKGLLGQLGVTLKEPAYA